MSESEHLYINGDIHTVDPKCPGPEALAVKGERIVAVGSADSCRAVLGKHYETVDLKGSCLLPGFIDTHLHPVLMVYYDMNVNLRGAASMDDLLTRFREAACNALPGEWIVGLDLDEQGFEDPKLPSRHDLDRCCPHNPAIAIKHDLHMIIANTRAIRAAGVSASTKDPEGGLIDRESDGYPAGPFREDASQLLITAVPMPELDALLTGAKSAFGKLAAHGITSVGAVLQTGEEGPAGKSGAFEIMAMSLLLEHAPVNLYGLLVAPDLEHFEAARQALLSSSPSGRHRIGGIKIFADGSFASCTAYMDEPFSDQPDKQGFLRHSEEEIYRCMASAHKAGLQIAVHAIGDAANRTCIDLYRRLLHENPKQDHRHRLEHASVLTGDMLEDIARLGLVVSTQPLFIHSEKNWLTKRLGRKRVKRTYPFRSILDAGIKLAGASDAPVESVDVLHAIQCCVTREGFEPQEGITPAEAIRMYTLDAAYAQFEEGEKGSLTAGKRADIVILSDNPLSVAPERIRDIRIEQTICGGKVTYCT